MAWGSAILEKTVQNIQDENNRLRIQLEALVSAAHLASPTDIQGEGHHPPAFPPHDVDETQSPVVESVIFPGPGGRPVDVPLGLGVDGVDLSTLDSLRRQLDATRREVTDLEARVSSAGRADADGDPPLAVEKTRTLSLIEEKQALVHLIENLKRDRDAAELDRSLLERELTARRALLAGTSGTTDTSDGEEREVPVPPPGEGKKHLGGEPGRDVGVERALMEVRSWLDDALTGWQKVRVGCFLPSLIACSGLTSWVDGRVAAACVGAGRPPEPPSGPAWDPSRPRTRARRRTRGVRTGYVPCRGARRTGTRGRGREAWLDGWA